MSTTTHQGAVGAETMTVPCGGCGAKSNAERCIGCLHDFGDAASSWVHQHVGSNDPAALATPAPRTDGGMTAGDWRKVMRDLIAEHDKHACLHEGTHRGGAIWTICDHCGRKWADDEGGFQPYEEPAAVTAAWALLKCEDATPAQPAGAVPDGLRALSEAATAGPFSVSGVRKRYNEASCVIVDAPSCGGLFAFATADGREALAALADAKFVVAAANYVRDLVAGRPAEPWLKKADTVIAEMIAVATAEEGSDLADEWPVDLRAQVDLWQASLQGPLGHHHGFPSRPDPAGHSAGSGAAWIVTNGETGDDLRFRMWSGRAWVWTSSLSQAARFAREGDAKQILPDGDEHGERVEPAPDSTRTGDEGTVAVPVEPTEEMWSGLARQIVMWHRGARPTGANLHRDLKNCGWPIPDWLKDEIEDADYVPPKGAVAVAIYRAMIAARPAAPEAQGAWSFDMEAAPQDGTRVLLWMQGCWIHPVIGYRAPSAPGSQRDCWREHGSRARIHRVDCWQPIPAPPASSGQGGR